MVVLGLSWQKTEMVSVMLSVQGLFPHPLTRRAAPVPLQVTWDAWVGRRTWEIESSNHLAGWSLWCHFFFFFLAIDFSQLKIWVCWFHPTYYTTKIINTNVIFTFYKSFKIPVPYLTLTTNSWSHSLSTFCRYVNTVQGFVSSGSGVRQACSPFCVSIFSSINTVMPTAADKRGKASKFFTG